MKYDIGIKILFFFLLVCIFNSCREWSQLDADMQTANFFYDNYIEVNAVINKTDTTFLCFDSGCLCRNIMLRNKLPKDSVFLIHIADTCLVCMNSYEYYSIEDEKKGICGMIGPDYENKTEVWNIDFQNYKLTVTDTVASSTQPADLEVPIKWVKRMPIISVPMTIYKSDKKIDISYDWFFDTGTPQAFCMTSLEKDFKDFFISIDRYDYLDDYHTFDNGHFRSQYFVDSIKIFNRYVIKDSLKCDMHTNAIGHNLKRYGVVGTIGLGIFKDFNFSLDTKNSRLILKKNPSAPKAKYTKPSGEGVYFSAKDSSVTVVIKNFPAFDAGVRPKDSKEVYSKKMSSYYKLNY